MSEHPTPRLADESAKAYAAFLAYIGLPPDQRSIDAAWRQAIAKQGQDQGSKRAPAHWQAWSSAHNWVARSAAFDEAVAAEDAAAWLERRRVLREADWSHGDELRSVVAAGLAVAAGFVHSEVKHIPATSTSPERIIIREKFDLAALTRALIAASKLQHGAVFWPGGEDAPLSPHMLDTLIGRELSSLRAERTVLEVVYTDSLAQE